MSGAAGADPGGVSGGASGRAEAAAERGSDRAAGRTAERTADRTGEPVSDRAAERAEAERLAAWFRSEGRALPVEADILQPADTLLDLYGEDIRARAYVTADPLRGELMLRPDFTVPVVQRHMEDGAEPARYTYMGPVFRRQEHRGARASEYLQVGFELFDGADPVAADAEVFALFARALDPLALRPVIGDTGLLRAAVSGLTASDPRKAALMRHIWRPARFRALLDRFGGRDAGPERAALIARLQGAPADALIAAAGPLTGRRGADEIAERIAALIADAGAPPIPAAEVAGLEALMALQAPAPAALERLRAMARDMPALAPAVARLGARLAALEHRGVAVEGLAFEAAFGRTTLEYYDGFVFGFLADRPGWPAVASGGRYDALTAVLGGGRAIPAVGGVVRPGLTARLGGAAC